MLKIDTHSHIIPEHLPRFADKFGYGDFIHLDHHRPGFANMMKGDVFFREIEANCWDPQVRIDEYAQFNTQVQVVCTIPVMFSYWAKPKDTLELSRFLNDQLAETVANHPKHYVGLGTLPMQDANLAVQELQRIKEELGLPGVQIGSNINNINLSDSQFDPIWEACEELDMCLLIHPWDMMGKRHMEKYWLPWLVGMPAETSRAICSMIFGGIFDRFPKMRVNFAHASGSFLATIGRVEHGFNCRPDLVAIDNPNNPTNYLGHFWVDSITHDPVMLRYVMNKVGANRVTIGSDYPFPLGDLTIGELVDEMALPPMEHEFLYSKAALEWLGLEASQFLD
ncbi:amidohydrolase family protein [Pontibacter sp. G13]|uniref:amidohydrolase family protein n=1 Tax=Pontibacter sp. G13 TaxID=3074898 RepID=UPI00288C4AA8|nr:amidohydrolase family protein [Pontibacter sp. G13]WNJ19404.1 amidohydrolase family protein [Pontibacter sp. G13]